MPPLMFRFPQLSAPADDFPGQISNLPCHSLGASPLPRSLIPWHISLGVSPLPHLPCRISLAASLPHLPCRIFLATSSLPHLPCYIFLATSPLPHLGTSSLAHLPWHIFLAAPGHYWTRLPWHISASSCLLHLARPPACRRRILMLDGWVVVRAASHPERSH